MALRHLRAGYLCRAGLSAVTVSRPITPYDIAPTLADYLGVKPPSGAIGNPLPELLKQ